MGNFDCGVYLPTVMEVGNNMCITQSEDLMISFEKTVKRKIPFRRLLSSEKYEFHEMVTNFYRSCAAQTIFDYILGTRDRYAKNIYMIPTGHVFRLNYRTVFEYEKKEGISEGFVTSEFEQIKDFKLHIPDFIN